MSSHAEASPPAGKAQHKKYVLVIVGVFVGVTVLWVGVTWLLYSFSGSDIQKSAQIGDAFGAANALFSAVAFAGVIVAILLQREELQLQREELVLTREELAKTARAQEKSQEALTQQAELQLLAAYLNALDSLRQVIEQTPEHFDVQPAAIHAKLLEIVEKLEPKIAYVTQRTVAEEDRDYRIRRSKPAIVNPVKEQLQKVQLIKNNWVFDDPKWIGRVKEKLAPLLAAIENAYATTDDKLRDSLQVDELVWVAGEIRKLMDFDEAVPEGKDQFRHSADFNGKLQSAISPIESWIRWREEQM